MKVLKLFFLSILITINLTVLSIITFILLTYEFFQDFLNGISRYNEDIYHNYLFILFFVLIPIIVILVFKIFIKIFNISINFTQRLSVLVVSMMIFTAIPVTIFTFAHIFIIQSSFNSMEAISYSIVIAIIYCLTGLGDFLVVEGILKIFKKLRNYTLSFL